MLAFFQKSRVLGFYAGGGIVRKVHGLRVQHAGLIPAIFI